MWAIFGHKYEARPSVQFYTLLHFLEVQSYMDGRSRREAHFSRIYTKRMEAEAKAKARR